MSFSNYPLISVIVPALNEEKIIGDCLRAIKTQDYPNFEIIVVSNGSTDNTVTIAKQFTSNVLDEPKLGAAKARNLGAKHARGSILVFIDGDTIMCPGLLKTVYESIKNGYVAGKTSMKGSRTKLIDKFGWGFQNIIDRILFYKLGIPGPYSYTPFIFCVRNDFEAVEGFPEGLQATEEIRLMRKLKTRGNIRFIPRMHVVTSSRRDYLGFKHMIFVPVYLFFFPRSKKVFWRDDIR